MDNTWLAPAVFVVGILEFGISLALVKVLLRILPTHFKLN
jgi:hypothetical protein